MKTITLNNKTLSYKIFMHLGEYGVIEWTEFYDGTIDKKYKKYYLFGPIIVKIIPNLVFKLNFNILDPSYTKKEVYDALNRQIELLNRSKEIANGEII